MLFLAFKDEVLEERDSICLHLYHLLQCGNLVVGTRVEQLCSQIFPEGVPALWLLFQIINVNIGQKVKFGSKSYT